MTMIKKKDAYTIRQQERNAEKLLDFIQQNRDILNLTGLEKRAGLGSKALYKHFNKWQYLTTEQKIWLLEAFEHFHNKWYIMVLS